MNKRKNKIQSLSDYIAFIIFIFGIVFISFIAGVIVFERKVGPYTLLSEAFERVHLLKLKYLPNSDLIKIKAGSKINYYKLATKILDVPKVTRTKDSAYNGYNLISSDLAPIAFLTDMDGKVLHKWIMTYKKFWPESDKSKPNIRGRMMFDYAHIFPDGNLVASIEDTDRGYGLVMMDKDSNVLWTYFGNIHDEFYVDNETGNIYVLVRKYLKSPPKDYELLPFPMFAEYIVVLSHEGKVLNNISILDAFNYSPFKLLLYHPHWKGWDMPVPDHLHTNSIMVLESSMAKQFPTFKAGQILVSLKGVNAIAVVDPDSKRVTWALADNWHNIQNADFMPNGNIMVFDNNGFDRNPAFQEYRPNFARLIEIDPKTLIPQWYYDGIPPHSMPFLRSGNSQSLPNGNILILDSKHVFVREINRKGDVVWSYRLKRILLNNEVISSIDTAVRYSESDLPFLKSVATH